MKLTDIMSEWEKDSVIDKFHLDQTLSNIQKLHKKYWEILINERLKLKALDAELEKLTDAKFWFFIQGHDEETRKLGWVLPPRGKITVKDEAKQLVRSDDDVIALSLRVANQREKSLFVEDIIKALHNRSYLIRSMIDFMKFQAGG